MAKKYNIKFNDGSVEMTKPNSTMMVYKIPYASIQSKHIGFIIPNKFIVYVLLGKCDHGKDRIYVGKSKNGIDNRPAAHEDKYDQWTTCYVLTQFKERTFFNDGTIQYLENELNERVNEVGSFHNTTRTTTSGTANTDDMEDCDDYLAEAYTMLEVLGLDLITNSEEAEAVEDINLPMSESATRDVIPDGTYHLERKIKRNNNAPVHATMKVVNGKYILLPGSEVVLEAGPGLIPSIDAMRNQANIEDGKLIEEIELTSPSAAGEFVTGASCNGWTNWRTSDGMLIDIYRNRK